MISNEINRHERQRVTGLLFMNDQIVGQASRLPYQHLLDKVAKRLNSG